MAAQAVQDLRLIQGKKHKQRIKLPHKITPLLRIDGGACESKVCRFYIPPMQGRTEKLLERSANDKHRAQNCAKIDSVDLIFLKIDVGGGLICDKIY